MTSELISEHIKFSRSRTAPLDDRHKHFDDLDKEIAKRAISRLAKLISKEGSVQRVQLTKHTTSCRDPYYWHNRADVVDWIADHFRNLEWEVSVQRTTQFVTLILCEKKEG